MIFCVRSCVFLHILKLSIRSNCLRFAKLRPQQWIFRHNSNTVIFIQAFCDGQTCSENYVLCSIWIYLNIDIYLFIYYIEHDSANGWNGFVHKQWHPECENMTMIWAGWDHHGYQVVCVGRLSQVIPGPCQPSSSDSSSNSNFSSHTEDSDLGSATRSSGQQHTSTLHFPPGFLGKGWEARRGTPQKLAVKLKHMQFWSIMTHSSQPTIQFSATLQPVRHAC